MLQTSKNVFESVLADIEEFKTLGQLWCDSNDKEAVTKARMLGKNIVKSVRSFAALSVTEEKELLKATMAEKPKVEEVPEVEEPITESPVGEVHVQ